MWSPADVNIKINFNYTQQSPSTNFPSAHNEVHIVILYRFHFLKFYLPSNIPLPEERLGTVWEPSNFGKVFILLEM
jgi:hypothetical protein